MKLVIGGSRMSEVKQMLIEAIKEERDQHEGAQSSREIYLKALV
jgi:hypothetical protein